MGSASVSMAAREPLEHRRSAASAVTRLVGPDPSDNGAIDGGDGPQGFRVALDREYEIGVHYHRVDQFQVVVAGTGTLGRHAVRRGAVHYTDAFTPYGPIRPASEGLTYLTLRSQPDFGASWMPASRADLAASLEMAASNSPRRNLTVDVIAAAATSVLLDDDDGLRVVVYRLEPGEERRIEGTGGSCRFGVVFDGTLALESGPPLPVESVLCGVPDSPYVVRAEAAATYVEVDLPRAQEPVTAG